MLGVSGVSGPPTLVRGGGQVPERGMPPMRIGAPLGIVEQGEPGGAPRWEAVPGEHLAFEGREAALGCGVGFRGMAGLLRGMGTPPQGHRVPINRGSTEAGQLQMRRLRLD